MKAKLHKMVSGYILSLNGDIDDPYAIVNEELAKDYEWYRLSLKNCQAIERGFDLDDIKRKVFDGFDGQPNSFTIAAVERTIQIMTELMGDKKFSEDDVILIAEYIRVASQSTPSVKTKDLFDEYQSLQQNEWEVEIETVPALSNNGNVYYGDIPKLDATGCLILKRI